MYEWSGAEEKILSIEVKTVLSKIEGKEGKTILNYLRMLFFFTLKTWKISSGLVRL